MQEKDKSKKQGKTNKSIRFPRAVAEEVTEQLQETGGTFSAFVIPNMPRGFAETTI